MLTRSGASSRKHQEKEPSLVSPGAYSCPITSGHVLSLAQLEYEDRECMLPRVIWQAFVSSKDSTL